ncbi:MAG: prealbumin-like fold domain-containing protein [Clostridiales Family XIII bacterium]|nr:prealbumin-like fold domain-containing protein [Clostridiales Family XIII bacterium]
MSGTEYSVSYSVDGVPGQGGTAPVSLSKNGGLIDVAFTNTPITPSVPPFTIVVAKADKDAGKPFLPGAEFSLQKEGAAPLSGTTNAHGLILFTLPEGASLGRYTLTETKAPENYIGLSVPIVFSVIEEELIPETAPGNTFSVHSENGVITFSVTNTRKPPYTPYSPSGGTPPPVPDEPESPAAPDEPEPAVPSATDHSDISSSPHPGATQEITPSSILPQTGGAAGLDARTLGLLAVLIAGASLSAALWKRRREGRP